MFLYEKNTTYSIEDVMKAIFWILLILLLLIVWNWETIRISLTFFLAIQRGLVAPSCFWWSVTDMILEDSTGEDVYRKEQRENPGQPFVMINFWGRPMRMVIDPSYIKPILDNSPFVFGAGIPKKRFFSTFMGGNLGISEGCPWKYRRALNEFVLDTDKKHHLFPLYNKELKRMISKAPPRNFEEFGELGQYMAGVIVFGTTKPSPSVFKVLEESNTSASIFFKITPSSYDAYDAYVRQQMANPIPNSMVALGRRFGSSDYEMTQQIPHWIFPIVSITAIGVPRALLLIRNTPSVYRKAKEGDPKYIRKCLLETLRLNNQVLSMFRTLLRDVTFPNGETLHKGDELVIFTNPVMRSPERFYQPDAYIPERWNDESLEDSYFNLIFSQGPQICPGKNLALDYMNTMLRSLLQYDIISAEPYFDTKKVPKMINPCKITFEYA